MIKNTFWKMYGASLSSSQGRQILAHTKRL